MLSASTELPGQLRRLGCQAAAILLAGLLMTSGAMAQVELARTHPGHLKPAALWPMDPPEVSVPVVFEGPGIIVLRTGRPAAQLTVFEPRLTDLCRYNLFHQHRDGWFTAVFSDIKLGVGFGHGLGLYDPAHAADRGRIYLFKRPASTACEVRSMPNPDQRYARAGG